MVHDHCYIGQSARLRGAVIGRANDIRDHARIEEGVVIGDECFVGVNVTLRDGIKIAPRCLIGAGALITRDTKPDEVYAPAATPASRVPSSRISP